MADLVYAQDWKSWERGSTPRGSTKLHDSLWDDKMEFVAQLVERQVVALVVMGSIPIKLPNASIAQW